MEWPEQNEKKKMQNPPIDALVCMYIIFVVYIGDTIHSQIELGETHSAEVWPHIVLYVCTCAAYVYKTI